MNTITAKITDIKSVDNLNIIKFDFNGETLCMMSLELPYSIKTNSVVKLTCKATNIGIGKNLSGETSYSNRLTCKVASLNRGELLCSLKLSLSDKSSVESIITKESALKMNLKEDDIVTAFIKASDLSIQEVIHD